MDSPGEIDSGNEFRSHLETHLDPASGETDASSDALASGQSGAAHQPREPASAKLTPLSPAD